MKKNYLLIIILFFIFLTGFNLERKTIPGQQLGHVVLKVSDLSASQNFYEDVLHLRTTEEVVFSGNKRVFLSGTESHHELVLIEGTPQETPTAKRYIQQVAFRVNDHKDLVKYYGELQEREIDFELKNNQISWSLYFYDPDSTSIEIYWDVRKEAFGKHMFKGEQEELPVEKLLNPPR